MLPIYPVPHRSGIDHEAGVEYVPLSTTLRTWMEGRYGKRFAYVCCLSGQAFTWIGSILTIALWDMPLLPGTGMLTALAIAETCVRVSRCLNPQQENVL